MPDVHLGQIDLNLLRVFDVLMQERSVTRAGARLGLTQSAVSHALGRLRLTLGDELFVRGASGMDPTPRALEIGPALHAALSQVQAALAPAGFDPGRTERRFSISAGPYGCAVLIPSVVELLRRRAPRATLQIAPYGPGALENLDAGRADAAVMAAEAPARRFVFRPLFSEAMVWAVRAGHPLAEGELTAERLLGTPHVLVSGLEDPFDPAAGPPGPGKLRRAWDRPEAASELAGRPAARKVAVSAPDSVSALAIASRSDMAAFVPGRLAAAAPGVTVLPQVQAPFILEVGAVFHEDRLSDPAVAWFARLLAEAAQTI